MISLYEILGLLLAAALFVATTASLLPFHAPTYITDSLQVFATALTGHLLLRRLRTLSLSAYGAVRLVNFLSLLLMVAQGGLQLYVLVKTVGWWCALLLLSDVAVWVLSVLSFWYASLRHWDVVYVVTQFIKMYLMWHHERSTGSLPATAQDLFSVAHLLTIPIVFLSIVKSSRNDNRIKWVGLLVYFLHFIDVTSLIKDGREKMTHHTFLEGFLFLLFATMGYLTCHLYLFNLFASVKPMTRGNTSLSSASPEMTPAEISSTNLEYYLLWNISFIDLPFLSLRIVQVVMLGEEMNLLLLKNIIFIVVAAILFSL